MIMKYKVKAILVSGYEREVQKVLSVLHGRILIEGPKGSLVKSRFKNFVNKIYIQIFKVTKGHSSEKCFSTCHLCPSLQASLPGSYCSS